MRKRKVNKRYLAGVLALVLAVSAAKLPVSYAAPVIETDRQGSLEIQVEDETMYGADIVNARIEVELYKIATVKTTGAFVSAPDFAELHIEDIPSGEEDWVKTAEDAVSIVEEKQLQPAGSLVVENGTGKAENLEMGLYLVKAKEAQTGLYTYSFAPYIISLPDNLYDQTKDVADDAWIYDVVAGLKPERENRYGSLKIRKTLQEFNAALRETTFVFDVEGVDEQGNTVYSNVASTTFAEAGTKETVLDQIPAGTRITVTEVYSGASYTLTSDPTQTGTIVADEVLEADFSNTYNGELTPGYGVTNHFSYSEEDGWQWSQLNDTTGTKQ